MSLVIPDDILQSTKMTEDELPELLAKVEVMWVDSGYKMVRLGARAVDKQN
jgi:hypothetical protein